MNFRQALEVLKAGQLVKRAHWTGYWKFEDNQLMMYCKDGKVINLKDSEDMLYTLSNIAADDWEAVSPGVVLDKVTCTFSEALRQCKLGKGMRLPQWKPDVVIRAQYPDEHSKMTAPYLYVESRYGKVPWKETMIELFAENWEIVE